MSVYTATVAYQKIEAATKIVELADDAPTLHLYVVDGATRCSHRTWRDPGREEWTDAVGGAPSAPRRP